MRTQRFSWSAAGGLHCPAPGLPDASLVLYFGSRAALASPAWREALGRRYPAAVLFGCSSGGQIADGDISDDDIEGVALAFDDTSLRSVAVDIADATHSRDCGRRIAQALAAPDLAGVLVFSDGLCVNGSALVTGLVDLLGKSVPICGGLAGDGAAFQETLVGLDDAPRSRMIGAVGFYGSSVRIGYGSAGGWEGFGPDRAITRSSGNVLMELDGQPALDLYERYLGPDDIKGLPGTALLYPLMIRNPEGGNGDLVRTVLAIDREARTMTFAGDVPKGWSAQLMRSSFERLAQGAGAAAGQAACGVQEPPRPGIALLISCIGRRLMMGQRIVDEIEAAAERLPLGFANLGFYSYGEISPHATTGFCELHNQTMTVMTISEKQ